MHDHGLAERVHATAQEEDGLGVGRNAAVGPVGPLTMMHLDRGRVRLGRVRHLRRRAVAHGLLYLEERELDVCDIAEALQRHAEQTHAEDAVHLRDDNGWR